MYNQSRWLKENKSFLCQRICCLKKSNGLLKNIMSSLAAVATVSEIFRWYVQQTEDYFFYVYKNYFNYF